MKDLTKMSITFLVMLTLSFSFILIGNMAGDNTPEASALTLDEADLCVMINTYVEGPNEGDVDTAGLIECIAHMNS